MSESVKSGTPATRSLADVFALQSQQRWTTARSSAAERKDKLQALRAAVLAHADDAADALYEDLRKPRERPLMREVARVVSYVDDALAHLDEWMQPEVLPDRSTGVESLVRYEAKGVVSLFGPWNFPFQLTLAPLVPILAAGNTALVKPNEMTPATSALIARILRSTFDDSEVAVFEGGIDVANELLDLPVDHIFFTGSPAVGRIVMAAAAKHLVPVTLELGGKCPAIVDSTTDVARAASQVARGKHHNSGQVCLAPDHVWVHDDVREEFVTHYLEWVRGHLYDGDQLDESKCSRIVNQRNLDRLQGYVTDAVERGAEAHSLGGTPSDGMFMAPVALVGAPLDSEVMQEEIFGPVLPIIPFTDRAEVVRQLRNSPKPLAMYLFTQDDELAEDLIASSSSGGVTVNGWATHFEDVRLPFGGVGQSGMGRYQGKAGFAELSNHRAVVRQAEVSFGGLITDG
ncbi:aldehyde dehydrogenase family protein [Modestobacter versicolor]|uniref:aldehyde dehydrogenase family protein n=1 Tax=Modestobacter versicolor TaxID=429133 RepID=UPI0034DFE410